MQELVNKLNSELLFSNAFIWEGSARHYFNEKESTDTKLVIDIRGNSEIEHDGDIRAMEDQIDELLHKTAEIDGKIYTIDVVEYTINEDDEDKNCVSVRGKVIFKIT